jgi:hypothetical protein
MVGLSFGYETAVVDIAEETGFFQAIATRLYALQQPVHVLLAGSCKNVGQMASGFWTD